MGTLTCFADFVRSVTQQVSEIGERPETGERPHFSSTASLDDLGHEVKASGNARRVLLELLALIGL